VCKEKVQASKIGRVKQSNGASNGAVSGLKENREFKGSVLYKAIHQALKGLLEEALIENH